MPVIPKRLGKPAGMRGDDSWWDWPRDPGEFVGGPCDGRVYRPGGKRYLRVAWESPWDTVPVMFAMYEKRDGLYWFCGWTLKSGITDANAK